MAKTELPDFMKEPEKIECINCGWEGQRDYLEDGVTCPECECADYIIESDENYEDDEPDTKKQA